MVALQIVESCQLLFIQFDLLPETLDLCSVAFNECVLVDYVRLHLVELRLVRLDELLHDGLGLLGRVADLHTFEELHGVPGLL